MNNQQQKELGNILEFWGIIGASIIIPTIIIIWNFFCDTYECMIQSLCAMLSFLIISELIMAVILLIGMSLNYEPSLV
jgi:hypothetical protein